MYPPCEQLLTAVGVRCWALTPPFSFLPLSLSSPICTSLPPYEQLLVVEGSGAIGVNISPSSLSSSCPALAVLVLVLVALVVGCWMLIIMEGH